MNLIEHLSKYKLSTAYLCDHEALAAAHTHRMEPENIAASKPGMKTTVKKHFAGL